jgi:hypothetical protein
MNGRPTPRIVLPVAIVAALLTSVFMRSPSSAAGDVAPTATPGYAAEYARSAEIDQELRQLDVQIQSHANRPNEALLVRTSWWSTTNAMTISSVVLLFGFSVLVLAFVLIQKGKQPEAVLRIFGTILIIVTAVFLVVAGYSDKQIAPVMGLLGTIVGYLLGKESPHSNNDKSDVK